MFSINRIVNKLPKLNFQTVIREKKQFTPNRNKKGDPGVGKRKRLVENNEELQELADYDFDLEADFMNVGASYLQHVQETKLAKERERFFIVKQKYFKVTYPNFLTWSDKEQIRHLYTTNPEEWTIEKLSDGFPALPAIIKKIATSSWVKKSEQKIHTHDQTVINNWKLFKEGQITDLPEDLVEHLNKFGNRHESIKPFTSSNKMDINTNKSMLAPNIQIGNEFSNIITSYEKIKNKNEPFQDILTQKTTKISDPPKEDTFLNKTNLNSAHITLGELQENIEAKARRKKISPDEQLMLKAFQDDKEAKEIVLPSSMLPKIDYTLQEREKENSKVSVIVKEQKDISHLQYPEKIIIPKNIFKSGYTYKLNDCYYDDDGEFLYRIPGMHK